MYWHDYKTEKPTALTVCLVELENVEHKTHYEVLTYVNYKGAAWMIKVGEFNDGGMVLRWIPLTDIIDNIKDEPDTFYQKATDHVDDFRDRLAVEYWQLSNRIEKLEKALITSVCLDDKQKELLHEQRKAMLNYKDVLFRRCCLNEVNLYKHSFTCKPAKDGEL